MDILATVERVEFLLNGTPVTITPPSPQTSLLDALRDLGLTGAKEGCAEGECGACMVAMVAARRSGSIYKPVNSCLMPAAAAAGHELYTVEALKRGGEMSAVQKAMAAAGASQCGYCTPGFVVSLFAEHYRPGRTGPCETESMAGNLCRCTGYRPIRDAALSLGAAPDDEFRARLEAPAPRLTASSYHRHGASFERPDTLEACLEMARSGDVRWIAGGTDLGVESNLRFRRWPRLISVEAVPELNEFSESAESVRIGAALPLSEIEWRWPSAPVILREMFPLFASPAIRNRATLGGNLATASPIGDSAPVLLALDAVLHLASAEERRAIPLAEFFSGYRRTALKAGEMIVSIEIPKTAPAVARFYKAAKRRTDDISTVAAAFAMERDASGVIRRARIALGGVAATPLRLRVAEDAVIGEPWDLRSVARIQALFEATLRPMSDHRGSAEYRLEVAKSLVEKFFLEAA